MGKKGSRGPTTRVRASNTETHGPGEKSDSRSHSSSPTEVIQGTEDGVQQPFCKNGVLPLVLFGRRALPARESHHGASLPALPLPFPKGDHPPQRRFGPTRIPSRSRWRRPPGTSALLPRVTDSLLRLGSQSRAATASASRGVLMGATGNRRREPASQE